MTNTLPGSEQLRAFIDRVLRLKEEQDTIGDDIREVYAEAKGVGFDKQAMGQLVTHLRKKFKHGEAKLEEQSAIFDLYLQTYEQPSHAHTREGRKNAPRPSTNDEPSPEAGPQAEASLAGTGSGTLADREGRSEGEAAPADLPTEFEPPTFLTRKHHVLRPYCQNPGLCAGVGSNHCHACKKAMPEDAA